ncbi:MAG: hypothetical protein M1832_000888 [Thelocarpon impressellum]|nr:MAG: hypothetical protein M1832_000888 [Thelocarpon impressellum]
MAGARELEAYRRAKHGRTLTVEEREKLVKPFLPPPDTSAPAPAPAPAPAGPPSRSSAPPRRRSRPIRRFVSTQLHLLLYTLIHTLFSFYIRMRHAYHAVVDKTLSLLYYHHRTPELIARDVQGLGRLPRHLSVILELADDDGTERLLDEVGEIAAWCACAGIGTLSVYERTGVLKSHVPATHRAVASRLHAYFGPRRPTLQLRAPHMPAFLNGDDVPSEEVPSTPPASHLSLLLLSAEDGRDSLVDLSKTLAEMSQRGKLAPHDVTCELIDAEVGESVMAEPDLLVLFGPDVLLHGYPPWQVRLTEIFHVQDNTRVGYQVFLRALHRFAKVQMRFGR